jgi:beta-phosphoglucomutase-like phosphatase (HAD superfamily)
MSTAFLFDLDGTLVDSVYQHVRAWHLALRDEGIDLSVWRIHRKIGMSGGLFTNQLLGNLAGRWRPARSMICERAMRSIISAFRTKYVRCPVRWSCFGP